LAVSDGKKNAASDNLARVSTQDQATAYLTAEEAQREDAPPGRSPQVGLGANERDNRRKEEEKVILPLGNTDVHQSVKPVNPAKEKHQEEEEKEPREDLHALMHATEVGVTTEESILSLS
jgi:hypothetical protein